ncbi:hypothetical protein [Rhizomonospora bruguierae]|nr:hypothetical protein [Micromonospora sp. NBRC 107566]
MGPGQRLPELHRRIRQADAPLIPAPAPAAPDLAAVLRAFLIAIPPS